MGFEHMRGKTYRQLYTPLLVNAALILLPYFHCHVLSLIFLLPCVFCLDISTIVFPLP